MGFWYGAVAIYGVGAQINTLVTNFSTAISSVFAPRVNRIAAEEKTNMNKQFTQLMIRVGRVQYLILMLVASGFVIFGRYFITNIYSTIEYAQAYPVALLLILPAMIPLIQNLGIEIQRAVNKHQVRAIIYFIMALLNVVISIPLAKSIWAGGFGDGNCNWLDFGQRHYYQYLLSIRNWFGYDRFLEKRFVSFKRNDSASSCGRFHYEMCYV